MTLTEVFAATNAPGLHITDRYDPCYRRYLPRECVSTDLDLRGEELTEITRDSDQEAWAAVDAAADVYSETIARAWVGGDWVVGVFANAKTPPQPKP